MAAPITVDDVAKTMRLEDQLSAQDAGAIELAIENAVGELSTYLHRALEVLPVVDELHELTAQDWQRVPLAQTPVVSITQVKIRTAPTQPDLVVDPTTYESVASELVFLGFPTSGWEVFDDGSYGDPVQFGWPAVLAVSYTAGLDGAVTGEGWGFIRGVLRQRAAREFMQGKTEGLRAAAGQLGITSLAVEGYSVSFGTPAGPRSLAVAGAGGFTAAELVLVDRWRRRLVR